MSAGALILCLLFLYSANFQDLRTDKVQIALQQIPLEDRNYLSEFFKGMLTDGFFGATLFGQKASSLFEFHYLHVKKRFYGPRNFRGWKIWLKYQSLFDIKNYLFIPAQFENGRIILFVHKQKMTHVLQNHQDFFRRFFSTPHPSLDDAVPFLCLARERPDQHIAVGLLLGYDFDSCVAFQKMNEVSDRNGVCLPLDQELFESNQNDNPFSFKRIWPKNPFFCAKGPGYRAYRIPFDPQTDEVQEKILHLYNSDRFLEDFLNVLVQ